MPCPRWEQPVSPHGSVLHHLHPGKCRTQPAAEGTPGLLRAPGSWGGVGSDVLCLVGLKAHPGPCAVALVISGLSSPCAGHHQLPAAPLDSAPTFPLILVIPNPISTDLIFTSTLQMNMLNIIIR